MCCGDHKPCSLGKVKKAKQLSIKRTQRVFFIDKLLITTPPSKEGFF